jgi:orotidine-5'-phosphate decarboxylase
VAFALGNRLIAALDVQSRAEADALVERLRGEPSWVKIGLELFCAEGPAIVRDYAARGLAVMLDLKLHDIPETVSRSTRTVAKLGAGLLTVHAGGGKAMLAAAVAATRETGTKVLAVTVLTSLDDDDLAQIVASPHEVAAIRAIAPPGFVIVTPGVRPAGAAAGDQKRVMTPAQARTAGADLVVVGRPLRDAAEPWTVARQIIRELA